MTTITQTPAPRQGIPWRKVAIAIAGILVALVVLVVLVSALLIFTQYNGHVDTFLQENSPGLYNAGSSVLRFLFEPDSRSAQQQVVQCRGNAACTTIHAIIFSLVVFFVALTGFAYTTLLERVLIARFQQRVGPNRVGPWGLLQPVADGVKLIFKEDIRPAGAYTPVYLIAPLLKAAPALIVIAVIPLGPDLVVPWFDGQWYQVPLALADPNVGVLWILAITSIATYGVTLAGWSSNNKYAILGGLRASAQMLSYELSLGLNMAVPIVIAGSMSLGDIIAQQRMIYQWYIFQNPLAAGLLFIALLAEVNRSPFDLPEAEQELTAGFMTEYSGMKFATFMMGEYLGMIGISLIWSSLFLGGYQDGFGLVDSLPLIAPLVVTGKVVLLLMVMIWIRATLPRIRYDRLMSFGWKIMVPLSLLGVGWTAVAVLVGDTFGSPMAYGIAAGVFFVVVVGGAWLLLAHIGRVEEADEEEALEDDPIVTGERRGLGWVALQALGGLVAVPFVLWNFTAGVLERLAALDQPKQESKAIEPSQSPREPTRTEGGD